jgi:hypothetical protein
VRVGASTRPAEGSVASYVFGSAQAARYLLDGGHPKASPPNNSLQPWTPAPHRTPALAGGARGCGEDTRTPAQTAGTGPSADPAGVRKVGVCPA